MYYENGTGIKKFPRDECDQFINLYFVFRRPC